MAVQEGPSFKRYAANGIATVYSIPFLLLSGEDLVVTLDGVMITSGITLAGVGNPTSTATFDVPPSGDLLFRLVIPFQRLADYQLNGDFLASTVNNDFDRIWLALKELRRDDNGALRASPLEPEGIPALPVAAQRQLRLLAFDEDGDPIPSNLTLEQLEEQPALALASAAAAQESAEMAALSETAADESASAASTSAGTAGAAATLAGKWAEEAEDVPVTTGPNKYSAKHWAAKAASTLASVVASVVALAARVTTLEGWLGTNGKSRCTAWVNFNGTGTVAIRDSYGIGSITDLGTGEYQVNFSTAMDNANYAVSGFAIYDSTGAQGLLTFGSDFAPTINNFRVKTSASSTGGLRDVAHVHVVVHGGRTS